MSFFRTSPEEAQGLRTLFVNELKDIYGAETELTSAIPKMIENATSTELSEALSMHLLETQDHITRLEEVFAAIGEEAETNDCKAMAGLIEEAEEIMEQTASGVVRDAGIISAGQKVEHYEIATYGTLLAFAQTLGETEAAELLELTLDEEKEADRKLTIIAVSFINTEAAATNENMN